LLGPDGAVDSTCTVGVDFSPPTAGGFAGSLSFSDSAGTSPQSVTLQGGSEPAVTVADELSFPAEPVGETSSPETLQIYDTGQAPLSITGVSIGGTQAAAFTTSSDGCTRQIVAPGASCSVGLTFTPGSSGSYSATLTLTDDAPGSPRSGACQIAIEYAPPAGGTHDAHLAIEDDGTDSPQQMSLSGGASLSGHVYSGPAGTTPVAGAVVIACQAPTCVSYSEATTSADGSYAISRLSPGLWNVNVSPLTDSDLSPGSAEISVAAGEGVVQDFELIAPEPISDGVSFDVGGGSLTSGVPVITADTPFSFTVPVRLGQGPVNGEHTFAFFATVGLAGSGGSAGGTTEGAGLMFTVRYNATGFPTSMSPILVGALACGSPGTPSPCASIGAGAEHAATVHERRARTTPRTRPPIATIADDCPPSAPPGSLILLNFHIQPNTNGGVQVTDSTGTCIFDPIGLATASPNGDPFHDLNLTEGNIKAGMTGMSTATC
jgi:hypothetical protein